MAFPGIGPLSDLSSPMRPSRGSLDGGRGARQPGPLDVAGGAGAADSVELSGRSRRLGGSPGGVTEDLRGLSADVRQISAAEAREALVAAENLSAIAAPDGALEAAAEAMSGTPRVGAPIPPQSPGILSVGPQRVLQLLGG